MKKFFFLVAVLVALGGLAQAQLVTTISHGFIKNDLTGTQDLYGVDTVYTNVLEFPKGADAKGSLLLRFQDMNVTASDSLHKPTISYKIADSRISTSYLYGDSANGWIALKGVDTTAGLPLGSNIFGWSVPYDFTSRNPVAVQFRIASLVARDSSRVTIPGITY